MILVAGCSVDDRRVLASAVPGSIGFGGGPDAGVGAQLEVSPSALNFGRVALGFLARERVTLHNAGNAPLAVPSLSWASPDVDFGLLQNPCLEELQPDESCELRLSLQPSREGALSAALHVVSAAGGSVDVPMTGEGLPAGNLILAPAPGSFEDLGRVLLGSSALGVFTVTNSGATPTGVLAFSVSRPEFALVAPSGMPGECQPGATSLAVGQACDVRVAFNPAERGLREATFTAETFGTGSVSTRLSGEGRAPGVLVAATGVIDFGGVVLGSGGLRTIALQNDGDAALTLPGAPRLEPAGVAGFSIKTSDCAAGRVLEGGASCSVQLEFRPSVANQALTAELVADVAAAAAPLRVALRGSGLDAGRLELGAAAEGTDFGAVLLGGSVSRSFRVTNPTPQTSGVLSVAASDGFVIAPPSSPEACVDGSTSLSEGQFCTVEVQFEPQRREVYDGSLTIGSALLGAKSLALNAQGIIEASIQVEPELDFGRVFLDAPSSRSFAVTNGGDQELPPPVFTLSGNSDAATAAFTFTGTCDRALAPGEQCEETVTFAPTQPVLHTANLTISAVPGGTRPVLLVGEGLVPGSLVLTAADGSPPDFGDVAIGATASKTFTLTNPNPSPSGPLVFRTDDIHFTVSAGDCNPGDSAGLVNGSSCSFDVTFAPADSTALTTNLSVQSTTAGLVGIELTGRGRRPATLAGTGNRDLGFANIGQPPGPDNEFIWTLDNTGDLASGALLVENDNPTEFVILNDGCQGVAVPGGASCTLTIRFTPGMAGVRSANVTVSDPTSAQSVPLALTGTGVQLAGLGESCINAECGEGECTRGVCCDRACEGTCQACVAGVCTDQTNEEPCGQGNGRCFGVDRCLLPDGFACGQGADCGSGNCEQRLGGQGPTDSICCNGDCNALGQQCNASGACEQPTAADGAVCGRPGDLPCAGGLVCKSCADGASRCTPAAECCDTCQAPLVCINGARCDCPPQPNGGASINCGGGLCIPSRLNACCPLTPDCDPSVPNCDPADNLCKQCVVNAHCGANQACNNGTCGCAFGAKSCGDGRCIPNNECCEANCGLNRSCNNGTCGCAATARACPDGRCLGANECCECSGAQCVGGVCQDPPSLVAPAIDFGAVIVGQAQADRSVTITNTGDQASASVVITESENGATFAFSSNCLGPLAGGTGCTVTVLGFTATQPGQIQAALNVAAGGLTLTIPLRATATAAAPVLETLFPQTGGTFPFGPTPIDTQQVVTWEIINNGTASTGVLNVTPPDDDPFFPDVTSCDPIPPGATCRIGIRYSPTSTGMHEATFGIAGFGVSYRFTGEGTVPP
jgi:hypothetical protein